MYSKALNLPAKLETGKAGKIQGQRISGSCEAPEVRFEVSFLGIVTYLRLCVSTGLVLNIPFFGVLSFTHLFFLLKFGVVLWRSLFRILTLQPAVLEDFQVLLCFSIQTVRGVKKIRPGNCFPLGTDTQLEIREKCSHRDVSRLRH